MTYYDQVTEAAALLKAILDPIFDPLNPRIGIVLGSGLGAVADAVGPLVLPYARSPTSRNPPLPATPAKSSPVFSTMSPSWSCRAASTSTRGTRRLRYLPMRVLGALGLRAVVLTNAAGGIADGLHIGQLVLSATTST